ncbi:hypothetical protein [Sporofaciens sp. SGI.106]|uniref:hypothetical protein n=1 Tax=Sporofaciens sp. SGI.106 TaxID=3420568 RepID=UPI003D002D31
MNLQNDYEIVANDETISFDHYIKRLFEICNDCNREVYLSEILLPLLSMCCPKGIKVVPVFDDRKVGKNTEEDTDSKRRMSIICAHYGTDSYVVPDFIFVPLEYSFINPCKPYLMVETKLPSFPKYKRDLKKLYNCPLEDTVNKFKDSELLPEINACDCNLVLYTDGITWMFLEHSQNEIKNKYDTIKFVNQYEYHAKRHTGRRIDTKRVYKQIDLSFWDPSLKTCEIETQPDEWNQLKEQITKILKEILETNSQTSPTNNIM